MGGVARIPLILMDAPNFAEKEGIHQKNVWARWGYVCDETSLGPEEFRTTKATIKASPTGFPSVHPE